MKCFSHHYNHYIKSSFDLEKHGEILLYWKPMLTFVWVNIVQVEDLYLSIILRS